MEKFKLSANSRDLPATQGMLDLVRTELKSDMAAFRSDMNGRFSQNDANLEALIANGHRHSAELARIAILMEEQNSRNQIVLEGLVGQSQRPDRIENRVDNIEKLVQSLARARS